jgi:hypothetical protein
MDMRVITSRRAGTKTVRMIRARSTLLIATLVSGIAIAAGCSSLTTGTTPDAATDTASVDTGLDAFVDSGPLLDGKTCSSTIAVAVPLAACKSAGAGLECDGGIAYALCNGMDFTQCVCLLPEGYSTDAAVDAGSADSH